VTEWSPEKGDESPDGRLDHPRRLIYFFAREGESLDIA
jgi:hypothetical protein